MKKKVTKKIDGKLIQFTNKLLMNSKNREWHIFSRMKEELNDIELNVYTKKFYDHIVIGRKMKSRYFPSEIINLGSGLTRKTAPFTRQLYWVAVLVKNYSDEITDFVQLSASYERLLISGKYTEAAEKIDEIEHKYGYSIWSIENRISLLELSSGLEKEKEFTNSILSNVKNDILVRFLVSYFSMRSERNVSYSWYSSNLSDAIAENFDEDLRQYSFWRLNPFYKFEYGLFEEILSLDDMLPLIDQYLSFIKVTQLLISTNKEQSVINSVVKSIKIILNKVNDQRLINLLNVTGHKVNTVFGKAEKLFIEALDAYTVGEYKECILICESIFKDFPEQVELYEIYIKSLLKINQELVKGDSIFLRVLTLLNEIMKKTSRSDDSYQEIMKLVTVFSSNRWAIQLYGIANKLYHYEGRENSIHDFISILSNNPINPRLNLMSNHEFIVSIETLDYTSSTSLLYKSLIEKDTQKLKEIGLPLPRFLKYSGIIESKLGRHSVALSHFQMLFESQSDILEQQDAFVGLVNCHIEMGSFVSCLELIVDNIFINENLYVVVPFNVLLYEIEKEGLDNVPLSLPIVYDVVSRHISSDKESRKFEAYEDYLFTKGYERPSQLDNELLEEDVQKLIYFLKNICTVDIMKYSTSFLTLEEVERERIFIYHFLSKIDPGNKKNYFEEIKKITQQMIIRKGIRQVEENKIHVDTDGIKRSLEKNLQEGFQRYMSLREIEGDSPDYITIHAIEPSTDEMLTVMASNEKHNLFQMLILELRDTFVSSNAYGLNGYLSMGFRHGTLSGQLRSSLIAEYLITTKNNQTNIYHVNEHWNGIYNDLENGVKNKLNELLDGFSRDVDVIINDVVKNWVQIKTEKKSV